MLTRALGRSQTGVAAPSSVVGARRCERLLGWKKEAQRAATDDNTRRTPLGNTYWFLHSASLIYHLLSTTLCFARSIASLHTSGRPRLWASSCFFSEISAVPSTTLQVAAKLHQAPSITPPPSSVAFKTLFFFRILKLGKPS